MYFYRSDVSVQVKPLAVSGSLFARDCDSGSVLTQSYLCISVDRLIDAFNRPHTEAKANPKSRVPVATLSVGARALSKHFHRGSDRWWGELKVSLSAIARGIHLVHPTPRVLMTECSIDDRVARLSVMQWRTPS